MEASDYLKLAKIGKGNNAKVEIVKKSENNKYYIMKSLCISNFSQEKICESLSEIHILKNIKSPFIIKFKDFFIEKEFLYIVLQFACGGDLNQKVESQKKLKKGQFPENQVLDWITQISLALYYLHEKNVIHCDIKLENIFLTYFDDVKVGDFGIAKILEKSDEAVKTCFGTPYYMSPELCEKQTFSKESDVWSLGCVFYYLLALTPPFNGENLENLAYNIRYNKFDESKVKNYSAKVRNLLNSMLQKNKTERISVSGILKTDIIYERIEGVVNKTKENELNFKINQNEYLNKIVNERYAESLKKLSDTEKEY